MENIIIAALTLAIVAFALVRTFRHFKKGGCCSSGNTAIREKKTLEGPVIAEKTLTIQGMHCENCAIRVENTLNRLEGVLCRVNLKRRTALVQCSREVPDQVLKDALEARGYTVTQIL